MSGVKNQTFPVDIQIEFWSSADNQLFLLMEDMFLRSVIIIT
jgi:hypothetical protein